MLECRACGRSYADRWRCECGHALDFADPPGPGEGAPPSELDRDAGLWAFAEWLPVERRVTLGEGWTPLVGEFGAELKLEYVFPSGSFKDRGATTTLSRAADLGVERVVGNAGAAIAQYAARAGIDARVYVPADAKAGKLRAIERAGADIVGVDGDRTAVTEACHEAVEAGEGWYASHAYNPAFYAGTATVAYEVAAQRGWNAPESVVLPLGHGTLFLGAYRGFRRLRDAGITDRLPRMLGVQAAGTAPVAAALGNDAAGANDRADGIQVREPARRDQILAAIEDSGGDAIAVGSGATDGALDRLHGAGFYVEPTCATALAGLERYRERGVAGEEAVVALTGSGLKS
ncbi:MAG: pyridoxal-phosphate dependent enzyme [Halobacteriaceae archaeon]